MQVGVSINRVAIEGYDERMGSRQEFEKFDRLRRVTKGGFPADVVDAYLTEHNKRRRAKQAGYWVRGSQFSSHLSLRSRFRSLLDVVTGACVNRGTYTWFMSTRGL